MKPLTPNEIKEKSNYRELVNKMIEEVNQALMSKSIEIAKGNAVSIPLRKDWDSKVITERFEATGKWLVQYQSDQREGESWLTFRQGNRANVTTSYLDR